LPRCVISIIYRYIHNTMPLTYRHLLFFFFFDRAFFLKNFFPCLIICIGIVTFILYTRYVIQDGSRVEIDTFPYVPDIIILCIGTTIYTTCVPSPKIRRIVSCKRIPELLVYNITILQYRTAWVNAARLIILYYVHKSVIVY